MSAGSQRRAAVVGDWVALAGEPGGALVVERLARRSTFTRRRAGSEGAAREQVIAANVDTAFLVTDARDYSPRRIERYLAIAREASAEPVIVLTKLDLYPDVLDLMSELRALAPHVAVHPVSSETGQVSMGSTATWNRADDLPTRLLGSRQVDARESAARVQPSCGPGRSAGMARDGTRPLTVSSSPSRAAGC